MIETNSHRDSPLDDAQRGTIHDTSGVAAELIGAVISLMPDPAVVVDSNGRILSVNEQAEALFGYAPGALIGQSIEILVPERVRSRHRHHRSGYVASPQKRPMGVGLELSGRRQDGSEFPVDISLAPLTTAGEQVFVAAVRDITDQRAAIAAQTELAAIVRSSLDAIISTTVEGRITNWNPAARSLLGYGREEMLGRHIAVLVPDHASIVLEELLDAAYQTSRMGARDTRWIHKDGHEIDVAVSISPLKDQSDSLRGFASIVRDITDRKMAENELRRLLAEEERLERQHAATAEIRLALLSGTPLDEALKLICEHASTLVEAPVVVICTKGVEGVSIAAAVGPAAAMIGTSLEPGTSLAERVIDSGTVMEIARRSEGSTVEVPGTLPDGPTLGVPIIGGGVTHGALSFVREAGADRYGRNSQMFAEGLSAQAALAFEIDRSRRDHEAMMLVSDRERIARDLHDHVIQRLFAAAIGLQGMLSLIDHPTALERTSQTIDLLDDTIRDIRNTIFAISRPVLGEPLLRQRVLDMVTDAHQTLGFKPTLEFDGPIDTGVPSAVVPHVLAVVQETLSNVARHARASAVSVQIALRDRALGIVVRDNGIGIGVPTRSSGLANLEERARLLNGTCDHHGSDAGGTVIEWRVPVDQSSAPS